VITTASVANLNGFVRMQDLENRSFFVGYAVYGTTKLENILFTRELGRRLAGTGVLATCFNPGPVATDLGRGTLIGAAYQLPLSRLLMKSPERGADTLVWLATQPADRLKQGGYYSNRRPGLVNPQARSAVLARQLWERTEELLGEPLLDSPRGRRRLPGYVAGRLALLTRAGLRQVDEFVVVREPDPGLLRDAVERSRALCSRALLAAGAVCS
jgi:hypothetical protein